MKEIVRASIEDCSQIERFRLVTRLGNAILSNGGEVFRAEQAMEYAARALRLEAFNAYVIANGIFSNVVIDGRFYSSRICHVPLAPTILCRVDALNDLSRKIAAGKCGPYEMRMRLEQIEQMKVIENRGKVLAGQMDALRAELEVMNDFSGDKVVKAEKAGAGSAENGASGNEAGNNDAGNVNGSGAVDGTAENGVGSASDGTGNPAGLNGETAKKPGLMRDKLTINANREEYGDGRAQIFDLGLVDARGNITNLLLKGEEFTIRERIRFNAPIQAPIFTYTIKDKKGTDLTGTNTLFEGTDVHPVKEGDIYDVAFTQKMTLQGGEYLLSMSCTGFEGGEHVVYHRLYDVANITVISNKNTVGVYDMEPDVAIRLSPAGEAAKQAESLSADEAAQEDLQA